MTRWWAKSLAWRAFYRTYRVYRASQGLWPAGHDTHLQHPGVGPWPGLTGPHPPLGQVLLRQNPHRTPHFGWSESPAPLRAPTRRAGPTLETRRSRVEKRSLPITRGSRAYNPRITETRPSAPFRRDPGCRKRGISNARGGHPKPRVSVFEAQHSDLDHKCAPKCLKASSKACLASSSALRS